MSLVRRSLLGGLAGLAVAGPASMAAAECSAAEPVSAEGVRALVATGAPMKTIAVDPFLATEVVGGSVTAEGMTALLTEALAKDGRFVVVERMGLGSVQAEQQLASGGAVAAGTGAGSGQLIGASAVVRAVVTKYEANAGGSSLNVTGVPVGRMFGGKAGLKNQKAVMEISLRLIDTTTGQVISTSRAQGSASSTNATATLDGNWGGPSFDLEAFRNAPIGQAGEQAIVQAVEAIAAGMRNVPWSAQVVEAAEDKVYVNAGADRHVQPGLTLGVYRKGRVLTDPSTGVVLDVELHRIGQVRIDGVREKLSTAQVVEGEAPARGDVLRLN